jgi:hypothetical protein
MWRPHGKTEGNTRMGLDMYLTGEKFIMSTSPHPQEDGFRLRSKTLELGYWRKHPNLHGYIVQTFAGGKDECQEIDLGVDHIRTIIAAIKDRELPHTTGFFFGASDPSKERLAEDIAIFERALAWVETDEPGIFRSVGYRASW